MTWLTNLKIGARLGLSVALTLSLMVLLAGIGYLGLRTADQQMERIVRTNAVQVGLLSHMSEQVHIEARVLRTMVMLNDRARIDKEAQSINDDVVTYALANRDNEATDILLTKSVPKVELWQAALDQGVALQREDNEAAYQQAQATGQRSAWLLGGISLLAMPWAA